MNMSQGAREECTGNIGQQYTYIFDVEAFLFKVFADDTVG